MSSTSTGFVPPVIPATTPTSTNPIPGGVFANWWLAGLTIDAQNPAAVTARYTLVKYNSPDGSTIVFSPVDPAVNATIPNLMATVMQSSTMQLAYSSLFTAIQADAQSRGLL